MGTPVFAEIYLKSGFLIQIQLFKRKQDKSAVRSAEHLPYEQLFYAISICFTPRHKQMFFTTP